MEVIFVRTGQRRYAIEIHRPELIGIFAFIAIGEFDVHQDSALAAPGSFK